MAEDLHAKDVARIVELLAEDHVALIQIFDAMEISPSSPEAYYVSVLWEAIIDMGWHHG